MLAILKEETKQVQFDTNGFATLPFVNSQELKLLHELYETHFINKKINGLYASHNSNPSEINLEISSAIKAILANALQRTFSDFTYFLGHFMVKQANLNAEFSLHQDWNILDEQTYQSVQIWIPLQNSYSAKGGMFVLPKSHLFYNNYRSGSYGIPQIPSSELFAKYLTPINLDAGEILIYKNSLFHGSYPNSTNQDRVSVIVNIVQADAPVAYYQKEIASNVTQRYNLSAENLLTHLPQLEKGHVPDSMTKLDSIRPNTIDNKTIDAKSILQKIHLFNLQPYSAHE